MMDLGIPLATERVKPGLSRVRRLLSALGEPQGRFPAIHVGGTNGKG
ncbi:MAG TPA: bifunctional folylpolyglutamate synthase/dihydrofolate synthase, partial [Candidatus Acetothermia bacterium]|nr:bifunctional folylpolyglutamate synthase/dihydrofolate synthase [Candidatus Acetothermia bacterium]